MKKNRVALALTLVLVIGPLTSGCNVNMAQIGQLLTMAGGLLTKGAAATNTAGTNTAGTNTAGTANQALQQGMTLLGQQPQAQQQLAQFQQTPTAPTVQGQ